MISMNAMATHPIYSFIPYDAPPVSRMAHCDARNSIEIPWFQETEANEQTATSLLFGSLFDRFIDNLQRCHANRSQRTPAKLTSPLEQASRHDSRGGICSQEFTK